MADSHALIALIVGAICSGLAGFGMRIATKANIRTTAAARTSLNDGLKVAFAGGSVMGLTVVGLGVLGLTALLYLYNGMGIFDSTGTLLNVLAGFSGERVQSPSPVWVEVFTRKLLTWC